MPRSNGKRKTAMFNLLRVVLTALLGRFIWLPIATAPRDGTVVDLWHKAGFRITEQWWDAEEGCWIGQLFDDTHFTHWSPVITPGGMMRAAHAEPDEIVRIGEYGEGQDRECAVCGAAPGEPCSKQGLELFQRVHSRRLS
jgi:hypothetical protein